MNGLDLAGYPLQIRLDVIIVPGTRFLEGVDWQRCIRSPRGAAGGARTSVSLVIGQMRTDLKRSPGNRPIW
jgi:hypothetical protein